MAVGSFLYLRPDELFTTPSGSVSGGAESTYDDDWLIDWRPGRPLRYTNGSPTWTVTGAAKQVSMVGWVNHNTDAARTITIGGDISVTMAGPAARANGINYNPWASVTPTSCTSVTAAISSNSSAVVVGQFVAGLKRTLERNLRVRPKFGFRHHTVSLGDAEYSSLNDYDKAIQDRTLKGDVVLSDSGLADVIAWWESTYGGARITYIVPDSNVQDLRAVKITEFGYEPGKNNRNYVSLAFEEVPRSRF